MIPALAIILTFQLIGETLSHWLDLTLPGPVIGLVLLVVSGLIRPQLIDFLRPAAVGLLGNLSLFFVPAGVGIIAHLGALTDNLIGISTALVVSTVLAIAVAALTFSWAAKWTGDEGEERDD